LPETFLVVLSPDGKVTATHLLAFYEPSEYAPPARWLEQFHGATAADELRVGRGIAGITGSTLTSEAVTAGIGICRVEQVGPLLLDRLQTLLGDRCTITVKPVIDLPAGHTPVDCYEIPAGLREQLLLRHPADVFPYAAAVSRRIDVDHTIPYVDPDEGGPPGQTRIGNLGPQTRHHHRLKTHGHWQIRQPEPGTWLWRSPHHRIYLINPTGTHPLGDTDFAETIWHAAQTQTPVLLN